MGCCGQNPAGPGVVAVDTCKRVNYTLGMLLGVDDFVQETAYHTARRHALAREVLGYGTVRGLAVVVEPDGDNGPRLRVTAGAAWLPSGTPVCVDAEQCCNLNDWLAGHAAQVEQALAADSPPAAIVLHVVLSYAACLTDNVIIPGEPCRSEDELMQPSRVTDGFGLELRLDVPLQTEEDAVRDFVDWLIRIPVVIDSPPLDEVAFIDQLRAAAHAWLVPTSPPTAPDDFMVGMPPTGLSADDGLLRAALRLWVTELRPLWMARAGCGCGGHAPSGPDDLLLLATLDVPLVSTGAGTGWRVSDAADAPVTIDERRRPVLLTLRMLQELIRPLAAGSVEAGGTGPLDPGTTVVPADAFGLLPGAGVAAAYSRADHSHGTPELPPLGGDLEGQLDADGTASPPQLPRVIGLRGQRLADIAPTDGQVLLFGAGEWAPGTVVSSVPVPALSGDLAGTLGGVGSSAPRVTGLQGRAVGVTAPAEAQVLMFRAGQWAPGNVSVPERFVGRGSEPYEIVAAGEIALTRVNGAVTFTAGPSYGKLRGIGAQPGSEIQRLLIELTAAVDNAASLDTYVVKLTPMLPDDRMVPYRLFLRDRVKVSGSDEITFVVLLLADRQIRDGTFEFRFQVEVSRFRSN